MARPHVVVEDDRVLRLLGIVLDPDTAPDRIASWADFIAHDEPDFEGWLKRVRRAAPYLYPARVSFVGDQAELDAVLASADALVLESLRLDRSGLDAATRLRVVQKFGTITSNVDPKALSARALPLETLRRRQNMSVAEHAFACMLALARRILELDGRVTADALQRDGFDPRPFDRRYMANSNYGRVPGLRTLYGSTVGVVGMGEIGREFASRCAAFGMRVLYHQRTRIAVEDEVRLAAEHVSLQALFARSDFVSMHLPLKESTEGIVDRDVLGHARPGTVLINTARAALVERSALMEALDSGRLGGFALDTGYSEPASGDEPLLGRPNVLLTPHTAPASRRNGLDDIAEMVGKLDRAFSAAR